MITDKMYNNYLSIKGKNLSEVRKYDAAQIMNTTFTGDVGYKRVYILDPLDGWIWTDAKYSEHTKQSIASDDVDYYLEFRPYEHHPVGTYVFIPNDKSPEVGFSEANPLNPFEDDNFKDIFEDGKLWMLVDRNNATEFVRYMILQCNWEFLWIERYMCKNKIFRVYGISRTQSSYTSGVWSSEYTTLLDQVTAMWLPDTFYIFNENIHKYNLDDTRYLTHDIRLMMSTNQINPKCYLVTKINELAPKGVLKCTVKQDEYDERKDNAKLLICDYYDEKGDIRIDMPINDNPDISKTSIIQNAEIIEDKIVIATTPDTNMKLGKKKYFVAEFSDDNFINVEWRVEFIPQTESEKNLNADRVNYYCGLLNITQFDETTISITPSKVKSLVGKKFNLIVQDSQGEYKSSIEVEVIA